MTKKEIVESMREGLDEMVTGNQNVSDPEWAKINGLRFMENYRIMRSLELSMDEAA